MNRLFTFLFALACGFAVQAQNDTDTTTVPKYWKAGGIITIGFNQVALHNWTGGGASSYSGTGIARLSLDYSKKGLNWENDLDMGYGILNEKGKKESKTDDRIEFNSSLTKTLSNEKWRAGGNFNFKSQFSKGYKDNEVQEEIISDFMSPGYTNISLGFDYTPAPIFTAYLSPLSWKNTYVMNQALADSGAYGVDGAVFDAEGNKIRDGKNVRQELGAYLRMIYKQEVVENVTLNTKVELYSSYMENPGNIDVNVDFLLDMKINSFLSTTLTVNLIYDDDILIPLEEDAEGNVTKSGPRLQVKEVLAIGINLKL